MSFDAFGSKTIGSERVSSLCESKDEIHNRSRADDLGRGNSSSTSASPSLSPAAQTFIFSIDGNGFLTRRAAPPHGTRTNHSDNPNSCSTPSNNDASSSTLMSDRGVWTSAHQQRERPSTPLSNSFLGEPPSTAAFPFIMRGVSCATQRLNTDTTTTAAAALTHPANANGPTPSSFYKRHFAKSTSASYTAPRFNNYVIGQSAPTTFRGSSATGRVTAIRQKPPRVPAATTTTTATRPGSASQSTPPPLTRASSCVNAASAHSNARTDAHTSSDEGKVSATQRKTEEEVADSKREANKPSFAAAAAASASRARPSSAAPAPVRPLLRHLPHHSNSIASTVSDSTTVPTQDAASSASSAGSSSAGNPTTTGGHTSASPTPTKDTPRRPHVPFLRMTRTFALRRPVLLTKDSSAAAAAAASGSRKNTPRASPNEAALEEQPKSPSATRPVDLPDKRGSSSPLTSTAARFPEYAPVPPRTASSQPQRSRRASLASMASASSATLHQHERLVDETAAAAGQFFQSMPSFSDAQNGRAESYKANIENSAAVFNAVAPSPNASATASSMSMPGWAAVKSELDGSLASGGRAGGISIASLPRRSGADKQPQPQRRPSRGLQSTTDSSHSVIERLRERGNEYMVREEFTQAIAAYSEGIRLAPSCDILGNRAAAFLLTFRYLLAVVDCLHMLGLNPGSVKAHWRAAKAYAAAYRFLDAKKYYLLAQQACMKEHDRFSSMASDGLSLTNGGGNDAQDRGKQDKTAKDRQSIAAEEAAIEMVEQYWQHMRAERWPEAVAVIDKVLSTAGYTGPTAVSWQALRLEALLPMHPKTVLTEAESLHCTFPDALELYYVLAKALFYTVHDAASTKRCLQLLDEAAAKRSKQNAMLNAHVRYAAMQLRECRLGEGGDTAAVQLEAWARRNQLREDSRIAELRHTIGKFARRRDSGNSAYEKGDWDAAAAAYTQCLQTDRLNHALLAAVYCNRTAVYMQAGRWREALSDANAAIQLNSQLVTAYSRRGRIQLCLMSQEYEAQRAVLARHFTTPWSVAVKEQLMRYADAAVADLTRAVELSPTADLKNQLWQALAQRQTVATAFRAPQPGNGRQDSASSSSSHRTFPRTGSSSGNGSAYQRSSTNSRSASATSPYGVLQQHLQLLGVNSSGAAAGALPDFKVIAKAYREAALRWHPDKWVTSTPQEQQEAERQFKLISIAYTSLRERYGDVSTTS